jgi:hypothetical protein
MLIEWLDACGKDAPESGINAADMISKAYGKNGQMARMTAGIMLNFTRISEVSRAAGPVRQ